MKEQDHAVALELPNNQNPRPFKLMFYGNQNVPHPCNYAAEKTDAVKVMRAVNEGK